MEEIWKPISGFEGLYEVSNLGRVRSVDRVIKRTNGYLLPLKGKILPQYKKRGNSPFYRLYVNLSKDGKSYSKTVHRLVASAFIPNPMGLEQVNHLDENPLNNNVWNLEWCSNEYNHNYGTRNTRHAKALEKSIEAYDVDGNFIGVFQSIKEAALCLHLDPSAITKVCKGKIRFTGDYRFRYV